MADASQPNIVRIGTEDIVLPEICNLAQLERIWPAMKALEATQDIVERTSARLAIISGALKETRPDLTIAELKKRCGVGVFIGTDQMAGLTEPVFEMLCRSGLMKKAEPDDGDKKPGEASPASRQARPPAMT